MSAAPATAAEDGATKPKTPEDEIRMKLQKTVRWYNKYGNLKKPLHYKDIAGPLKRLGGKKGLWVLKGLDEKAATIESPTAWVLGYVNKLGEGDNIDPETDPKVRQTVSWYNKYGGLKEKLYYREVAGPFSRIRPWQTMQILKELDDKKETVKEPTRWAVGYARYMEKEAKIKRTVWWYNKHGGLKAPLEMAGVVKSLSFLESWQAMNLLAELGKKAAEVNNPTAWVCSAAWKWSNQQKQQQKERQDKATAQK